MRCRAIFCFSLISRKREELLRGQGRWEAERVIYQKRDAETKQKRQRETMIVSNGYKKKLTIREIDKCIS